MNIHTVHIRRVLYIVRYLCNYRKTMSSDIVNVHVILRGISDNVPDVGANIAFVVH